MWRPDAQSHADLTALADAGLDHVATADHVSFRDGAGRDGLIDAAGMLASVRAAGLRRASTCWCSATRSWSPASSRRWRRPHRGVSCSVSGSAARTGTRSRCAASTRAPAGGGWTSASRCSGRSSAGGPVTHRGAFFDLDAASVRPAPSLPVPLVVGGRSDAAVCRAARLGDGWLGIWVSARRYGEVVARIADLAGDAGRGDVEWRHGLNVWCGLGADRADGREHLAAGMTAMYGLPFESFERWSPYGTPEEVAAFLAPYVDAGARDLNLICPGPDRPAVLERVAEVRRLLLSR